MYYNKFLKAKNRFEVLVFFITIYNLNKLSGLKLCTSSWLFYNEICDIYVVEISLTMMFKWTGMDYFYGILR